MMTVDVCGVGAGDEDGRSEADPGGFVHVISAPSWIMAGQAAAGKSCLEGGRGLVRERLAGGPRTELRWDEGS